MGQQVIDSILDVSEFAGLTPSVNQMLFISAYSGGATSWQFATISSFGRSLVDDANAAAVRTTLGLGTAALSNVGDFEPAGAISEIGIADIPLLQESLDAKAPLDSPGFTGIPTGPTQTAGNSTTRLATTAFVSTAIGNLIDGAPGAIDTLNELAAALGDDPNFATTVTNSLAGKLVAASNLSDLTNAATARTNLGLSGISGSQAAKLFWATPSGGSGVPSMRTVAAADVPGLAAMQSALVICSTRAEIQAAIDAQPRCTGSLNGLDCVAGGNIYLVGDDIEFGATPVYLGSGTRIHGMGTGRTHCKYSGTGLAFRHRAWGSGGGNGEHDGGEVHDLKLTSAADGFGFEAAGEDHPVTSADHVLLRNILINCAGQPVKYVLPGGLGATFRVTLENVQTVADSVRAGHGATPFEITAQMIRLVDVKANDNNPAFAAPEYPLVKLIGDGVLINTWIEGYIDSSHLLELNGNFTYLGGHIEPHTGAAGGGSGVVTVILRGDGAAAFQRKYYVFDQLWFCSPNTQWHFGTGAYCNFIGSFRPTTTGGGDLAAVDFDTALIIDADSRVYHAPSDLEAATAENDANAIVRRDAGGGFAAGPVVVDALTSGQVIGTATTEERYETAAFPQVADRNNFTGCLGHKFTCQANVEVTRLMLYWGGRTNNHRVNIWQEGVTGAPVASGIILNSGTADSHGYKGVDISPPVSLSSGTTYRIASDETAGGDSWQDLALFTLSADFSAGDGVFSTSQNTYPNNAAGSPGSAYNTATFRYSLPGSNTIEMGEVPEDLVKVHGHVNLQPATTPPSPTASAEVNEYFKNGKKVIQYNDGGTVRYKYLDLTGTGVTWVHTTSAP